MDYPSANDELVSKRIHIHVFHGHNVFSKFAYRMGKYDQIEDVSEEDMKKVRYYALKMALDAKKIPSKELYELLKEEIFDKI